MTNYIKHKIRARSRPAPEAVSEAGQAETQAKISAKILCRCRWAGRRSESGSILIYAVLMLGSILAITLSLAAIFVPKIRSISNAGAGSVGAIYAADSALEWCIYTNRGNPAVAQPVMANGAAYTFSGDCAPSDQAVDVRAIGTYRGVSRSLEVTIPASAP